MGMDYAGKMYWKKKTHTKRFDNWYKHKCGKCKTIKLSKDSILNTVNNNHNII